jgi:uncharacterized protein (DUF885 family)
MVNSFLIIVITLAAYISVVQTSIAVAKNSAVNTEASAKLHQIVEAYFEAELELNPILATSIGDDRYNDQFPVRISNEWRERSRASDKSFLHQVKALDASGFEEQDRISYQILVRDLEESLEGYSHPSQLLPLNQFYGVPNFFAQLGSGTSIHPFKTVENYRDFLGRVDGFERWVDQAITNMRKGIEQGIVQPSVLMERTLPQLSAHIVENVQESIFYRPIRDLPETFASDEKAMLTQLYSEAILNQIIPAYQRLHDFVKDEYLPKARSTAGMLHLPGGRDWYRYQAKRWTTTDLTPNRIHEIGLSEVIRIQDEMRKIMEAIGVEGTLADLFEHIKTNPDLYFKSRDDLLRSYRSLQTKVDASTDKLFDLKPESNYEIRPVEAFREKSAASGMYMAGPPDGSRPGVFYVNTYDLKSRPRTAMTTLLLHEGSPGHHFQNMIQRELKDLPRFRRFGRYGAYNEGWGLYSETLGSELGLYEDPYQYYGALEAELWRSIRLVLDTGIHAKGWSREAAIEYARENSAVGDTRIVSEVERFMAMPGQALSYKIGQLKIRELREKAERELAGAFDIKEFHRQILIDGALPLDVLERKIDQWIAKK